LENKELCVAIAEEMKSRMNLINHILSGDFYGEEFCRYSAEIAKGDKLITTRLARIEDKFSISFILQEQNGDSWEDIMDMDFIKFAKGNKDEINYIITDEVFNSVIPTMTEILNKHY
jgi:hypothetical protein